MKDSFAPLLILIAFGSFACGLWKWIVTARTAVLPAWRRAASGFGCIAVSAQGVGFFVLLTRTAGNPALVAEWLHFEVYTLIVAVPLVLCGRGLARWGMFLASLFLFVICFFVALSA